MPVVATELLIIFLLLLANGAFALAEIALVSARKSRLQHAADRGDFRARVALSLQAEPGHFLSTVQVGITLVGILTGAFSGGTLVTLLNAQLARAPALAPYSHPLSLGLVVMATTFLSVVIGELVPKRLGLQNPEKVAVAMAVPMRRLSTFATPVVWILSRSSEGVLRLLGLRASTDPPVTEEDVKALIRHGAEAGVFEPAEHEMLGRVIRLGDRRVGALMVPRPEVVWLDAAEPVESIREKLLRERHARYPVCEGSPDRVLGVVHTVDLLAHALSGAPLDLRVLTQPAVFVPEGTRAGRLLERFRETRSGFAVVIDEHGGTQGVVTAADILRAIVGEAAGIEDDDEPAVVRREDGSWLVDASMPVDEFNEEFQLPAPPAAAPADYETLGGMVSHFLGRIPRAGDHFQWAGLRIEVVDMDGLRVDKVLVSRP